ncbi:MAG: SRPBCC domain-containing protein [Acidobacteriota bacterium]
MNLTVAQEGDRTLVVRRFFAAPPEAVYRAHTEPELVQQWVLGPPGWTMPVCRSEPKPGGEIYYEWVGPEGEGFHLTGEFVELVPFERTVHVERMHLPDPTPDNRVVTTFEAVDGGTRLTMRMTVLDAATRAQMLESGMTDGMEMSYQRLDGLLPTN